MEDQERSSSAPAMADEAATAGGGAGPNGGTLPRRPSSSKLRKTSAFRGVAATENGQWRARIRYGKYTVHLGR